MTFYKGTPIAGVFAGTQYATATISPLLSQRRGVVKHTTVQMAYKTREMKAMKTRFDLLTLSKALVSKA